MRDVMYGTLNACEGGQCVLRGLFTLRYVYGFQFALDTLRYVTLRTHFTAQASLVGERDSQH